MSIPVKGSDNATYQVQQASLGEGDKSTGVSVTLPTNGNHAKTADLTALQSALLTALGLLATDQDVMATNAKLEAIRLLLASPALPAGAAADASVQAITTKLEAVRLLLATPALASGAAADTSVQAVTAKVEQVRALLAGTLAISAQALPLPLGAAKDATAAAILAALPASLGAKLAAGSLSVAPASDALFPLGAGEGHVGEVGSAGAHPSATPIATALTYATGKCIGGLNDLLGFLRASGRGAMIQSATLRSKVAQSVEIDLVIFRDVPAVTTGLVDGASFVVDPTEINKVAKVIKFTTWDSVGVACLSNVDSIGKYMTVASGTGAKCILVARGAVTLTTASDLVASLGLIQD